jgi:hypothetical protein
LKVNWGKAQPFSSVSRWKWELSGHEKSPLRR